MTDAVRTLFETLTDDQQRLYVHQLAGSGFTAKAIASSTGLTIEAVQRLLLTETRPTLTMAHRRRASP